MTATRGSPRGKPTEPQAARFTPSAATFLKNFKPNYGLFLQKGAFFLDIPDKQRKKQQPPPQKAPMINLRWVVTIMVVSLLLSILMSYASREALANANTVISFAVLFLFIALGIVFDMIGVAATSATEKEFHSMAAHKVRGAKEAVWMTRNAEKVSSICNDVVGDICGIISGATGALIVASLSTGRSAILTVVLSLSITGLVSATTIGGKAAGKGIAIGYSGKVLADCGRILSVLPLPLDKKK